MTEEMPERLFVLNTSENPLDRGLYCAFDYDVEGSYKRTEYVRADIVDVLREERDSQQRQAMNCLLEKQSIISSVENAIVHTVYVFDDNSFHIFSTEQKATEFADKQAHPCVISTYMIDNPERYYEVTQ